MARDKPGHERSDRAPRRRAETDDGDPTPRHPELVPAEQVTAALEAAAEFKDKLLRTLAEMENLRKRTEREVADARQYAIAGFARDVLAVADNMHRALEAIDKELRQSADTKMKSLVEGVELTERELMKVLERNGVRKVLAARREIRSQPASGDVRSAGWHGAAGHRRAGDPGRLHARRSRAASGDGRGRQGKSAPSAARPTTIRRPTTPSEQRDARALAPPHPVLH